jgi:predicted DNA-binding protein
MAESKIISAKLPESVFNMLDAIAAERKREKEDIVKEALELYIEDWEDYKIAIRRLKDSSDEILSEEEFLSELRESFGWKV